MAIYRQLHLSFRTESKVYSDTVSIPYPYPMDTSDTDTDTDTVTDTVTDTDTDTVSVSVSDDMVSEFNKKRQNCRIREWEVLYPSHSKYLIQAHITPRGISTIRSTATRPQRPMRKRLRFLGSMSGTSFDARKKGI